MVLQHQPHPPRRQEASGPGWREHFVDAERASASASVGMAVSESLSYVTIPDFATPEERRSLRQSALDVQNGRDDAAAEGSSGDGDGSHVMFASGAGGNFNCSRYSVEALLNAGARAASSALTDRLLTFLGGGTDAGEDGEEGKSAAGADEDMAELARRVFGIADSDDDAGGSADLDLGRMRAVWYEEPNDAGVPHPEPKVNLYGEGGYFRRHEDGMDLTLLVVLSDDFEGGGTAFYKEREECEIGDSSDGDFDDDDKGAEPESVARPPAGTAVIWGKTLQHMALPVTKGSRSVYVGSFDLKYD